MIIEMGKGAFLFSCATLRDGKNGLLIRRADRTYERGTLDREKAGESPLKADDIFIVIPDLQSALILQEQIVMACIKNLGWERVLPASENGDRAENGSRE